MVCYTDSKGHLKLADFGLSKIIREQVVQDISYLPNSVSSQCTNLDVNDDVAAQLQKYLPLKAYLANQAGTEGSCVPVLLIAEGPAGQDSDDKVPIVHWIDAASCF